MSTEKALTAFNLQPVDQSAYQRIVNGRAVDLPEIPENIVALASQKMAGDAAGTHGATSLDASPVNSPPFDAAKHRDPETINLAARVHEGNALLQRLGLGLAFAGGTDLAPGKMPLFVVTSPAATTTTLVISGNNKQFSLPIELLLNRETNLILIRDPKRCFCFAGLPGLGADYQTTVHNLRRIIESLNTQSLFCVGISAGGSASLKLGCDLQANGILGFSVPTTLNLDDDPGAELRHYPQLTSLYKYDRSLGIDLGQFYGTQIPRPAITLVYSPGHVRDGWLAHRMAGIAGVELVEAPGYSGHDVFRWMNGQGMMPALFDKLFAAKPIRSPNQTQGEDNSGSNTFLNNLARRARTALDQPAMQPLASVDQ